MPCNPLPILQNFQHSLSKFWWLGAVGVLVVWHKEDKEQANQLSIWVCLQLYGNGEEVLVLGLCWLSFDKSLRSSHEMLGSSI